MVDLFMTGKNPKLPICVSLVPDPMAWNKDAFQHQWDTYSKNLSIPSFCHHKKHVKRGCNSRRMEACP